MLRTHDLLTLALLGAACAVDPQPDAEPRSEADAKITDHVAQIVAAHDADGDGALSQAEAEKNPWLTAHFEEADLDGDGKVTPEEAASLAHEIHAAHCDDGDCDPHESPKEHVQKVFAEMDADADAFVTPAEAEGFLLEHVFTRADGDADGRVSKAELEAFAAIMHGEHASAHAQP